MTQHNKKLETEVDSSSAKPATKSDNLHQLPDSNNESQVLDINKQMTGLEDSIGRLNKKLDTSNKQIKKDVARLNRSEADITEKVAETYRQLGQIEVTFKDLGKQSGKITADIKSINNKIKVYEQSSTEALNQAIDSQLEVNTEFKQQHESIIDRAQKLSKKAESISRKLNKSIRDNSSALTELEAKIITELEKQAHISDERDQQLDGKIQDTNKQVGSQKAKMLMMQSVDEALDKRASALEKTAQLLLTDTEELKKSTEVLDILTGKLSDDVEALEIHTARLSAENKDQQGFIEQLQQKTDSMTRTLIALVSLEKKHFRVMASSMLVVILAMIGLFFYGEYQRDIQVSASQQHESLANEQLEKLQHRIEDEQMASQVFYSDITDLKKNIGALKKELDGVNTHVETINEQVVEMNDQVESIDGRIRYIAPLHNFGSDNTIHGSDWLAKLDSQLYSVKVATVSTQQDLYETASRYNYYLDQDLGYFINADGSYTLIHGGRYKSDELELILRDMPSYINFERVSTISNAEILEKIKSL